MDYRSDPDRRLDDNPDAAAEVSPRGSSSGGVLSASDRGGDGGGGSLVIVKVVFAPHQLMHNRSCVDQVERFGFSFLFLGGRVDCFIDALVATCCTWSSVHRYFRFACNWCR